LPIFVSNESPRSSSIFTAAIAVMSLLTLATCMRVSSVQPLLPWDGLRDHSQISV
jgi:hypothetical protein